MKNFKSLSMLMLSASALTTISTASADVVHLDDVIVSQSLCVGNDCVNGESFGFDTMRVKENNLRIHFDDTSTSASFPRNDWRLVANDSANGGGSYFAIEDSSAGRQPFRVEAGAPASSLYVEDGGRVGFGTSTPVVDLHVKKGNTPTLRLEQDGSNGFTPQTWDVAANEANFFIRDATNGSTLPFRIRPGAPSSAIDVSASGNVGISTDNPNALLHVRQGGASFNTNTLADLIVQDNAADTDIAMLSLIGGSTANVQLTFGDSANQFKGQMIYNNNLDQLNYNVGGTSKVLSINADGSFDTSSGGSLTSGGTWTDASSRTLKKNIETISFASALQTVMALNPVSYNYKKNPGEDRLGFIAEEVPEHVAYNDRARLSSMDIVAVLTKVVQDQQEMISELKAKVDQLIAD